MKGWVSKGLQEDQGSTNMNPRDLLAYHKARRMDETKRDATRLRNETKQTLGDLKQSWQVRTTLSSLAVETMSDTGCG